MTEANEQQTPERRREDAVAVVKRLREAGHEAYFAGGCVRDELLGLTPEDFDVATSAPPNTVRGLFLNTQAVGAAFGVILVRHRGSMVEVATFRTEFDYQDGRRPSVVGFATAEEDAQRRDFTINGLFFDPIDNQVKDFVGGQADLQARVLRAIGAADERFNEDHLRLLRAVRFAGRFGLSIEPATAKALGAHAPLLKRISPERIAEELRKMLTVPTRRAAWRMLWEFSLNDIIFRYLATAGRAERAVFEPVRCPFLAIEEETIPFGLALAAGCLSYRRHGAGAAGVEAAAVESGADVLGLLEPAAIVGMVKAMRQALRLSNEEADQMQGTLGGAAMMIGGAMPGVAGLKRFMARPTASLSRILMKALWGMGLQRERIQEVMPRLAELDGTVVAPEALINGEDLKTLGIIPGPAYGRILEQIYDLQLEGRIGDRIAAMRTARELVKTK